MADTYAQLHIQAIVAQKFRNAFIIPLLKKKDCIHICLNARAGITCIFSKHLEHSIATCGAMVISN